MPRKPSPWVPAIVGDTSYDGLNVGIDPDPPIPPKGADKGEIPYNGIVGYTPLPGYVKLPPGSMAVRNEAARRYKEAGKYWGLPAKDVPMTNRQRVHNAVKEMYPGWPIIGGEYPASGGVEGWKQSGIINEVLRGYGLPENSINTFEFAKDPTMFEMKKKGPTHYGSYLRSDDHIWIDPQSPTFLSTAVHEPSHTLAAKKAPYFTDTNQKDQDIYGQQKDHFPRGIGGDRSRAEMLEMMLIKKQTGVPYPNWVTNKYPNLKNNKPGFAPLVPWHGKDSMRSPYTLVREKTLLEKLFK